jgi:hypothetical protein
MPRFHSQIKPASLFTCYHGNPYRAVSLLLFLAACSSGLQAQTLGVGVLNPNVEEKSPVSRDLPVQVAASTSGSFAYFGSPLSNTFAPANPSTPISDKLFGMTIYNLAPNSLYSAPNMTPFPSFPVSNFRFWDVVYWSMIDSYEGQSNYTKMDNSIDIAQKNGVSDFIFTFGNVPA